DIDANGILNVTARDMATGKSQNVRIEASSGLTEADIQKMVNDAKSHETEDKEKRHRIDVRNNADASIFQTEKNLKEYGDKLDADNRARIEAGINRVKEAIKSDNIGEMERAMEALNQLWHAAAATMYQKAAPGAEQTEKAASDGDQPKKPEDKPVDADFEVVN
ncbi:MAG: Hsp70 family protein, partial [candidate division Zixibacteria bacterium]|nr:Hsp70 family protein [candidate division Zixibacteria bacterium]